MPFKALPEEKQVHNHPSYNSWRAMKARCHDPRNNKFASYGAIGIIVCDRWRSSFSAFVEDMGIRPSRKHSIDRIDRSGNYEPGNCRWATSSEQTHNQGKRLGCKSKFRGVTQVRQGGKWRAKVGQETVGWYETELEAAEAYDRVAGEVFGVRANLNFPRCPA